MSSLLAEDTNAEDTNAEDTNAEANLDSANHTNGGPLLQVRDLVTEFKTSTGSLRANSGITFDLEAGEVLGILGESGSGKSALLRTILGIQPKSTSISGQILIDGVDLLTLNDKQRRATRGQQIAMVFQAWSAIVPADTEFTIVDLEGNQAVDCVMYAADDTTERYSAADTMAMQRNVFLTQGTKLRTTEGRVLMGIIETGCERHDTLGGACSKESNTLRYGHHTYHQHACVENFTHEHLAWGLGKKDIQSNINWFMNVPVDPDGSLGIVDGISGPGLSVKLRVEIDTLVIISNCPQVNNPCNGFNPTPVRVIIEQPA